MHAAVVDGVRVRKSREETEKAPPTGREDNKRINPQRVYRCTGSTDEYGRVGVDEKRNGTIEKPARQPTHAHLPAH